MNKKTASLLTYSLILALLLSACSMLSPAEELSATQPPPSETPTRAPQPTATQTATEAPTQGTVILWHAWDEADAPALVQILADFRAFHSDVLFDVRYIPAEDLQKVFEVEAARGGGPTVLLGPAQWGPALYEAGLLADVSELAGEELTQELNQAALGAARYGDALIGLPYLIYGVVLYRNKQVAPNRAATFEELVPLAQAATQGEQVGAILERSFYYAGAHLEGIGGQLMDSEANPAFNNAKGMEWLALLKSFEEAGPPNYFNNQDVEYFSAGSVGWIIDGTWNMFNLAEAIGAQDLAIDPWPAYGDGALSGYVQAENAYLSARASGEHLAASWEFIEYFLSPEAQIYLTEIGRIPASSGVQVVDITTGHLLNQAMSALAGGTTYPMIPEMDVYAIQMDIALKSFFDGAMAEEVLFAVEAAIQEQLEGMRATPTP